MFDPTRALLLATALLAAPSIAQRPHHDERAPAAVSQKATPQRTDERHANPRPGVPQRQPAASASRPKSAMAHEAEERAERGKHSQEEREDD